MVDIYSDPVRDVKAARRLAFALVIGAAIALLPVYWLLANLSLVKLAFLLLPTRAPPPPPLHQDGRRDAPRRRAGHRPRGPPRSPCPQHRQRRRPPYRP